MRAYGYGFEKYYFNVEMGPNNEFRFLSWGLSASYVDMKEKTYGANGLLELTFSGGTRISNKMKSLYLKASIDGNFHYGSNYLTMGPEKLSVKTIRYFCERVLAWIPGWYPDALIFMLVRNRTTRLSYLRNLKMSN